MSSAPVPHKWDVSRRRKISGNDLDEMVESVHKGERVLIGADLNGHVGEGNKGDEEVWEVMR